MKITKQQRLDVVLDVLKKEANLMAKEASDDAKEARLYAEKAMMIAKSSKNEAAMKDAQIAKNAADSAQDAAESAIRDRKLTVRAASDALYFSGYHRDKARHNFQTAKYFYKKIVEELN